MRIRGFFVIATLAIVAALSLLPNASSLAAKPSGALMPNISCSRRAFPVQASTPASRLSS